MKCLMMIGNWWLIILTAKMRKGKEISENSQEPVQKPEQTGQAYKHRQEGKHKGKKIGGRNIRIIHLSAEDFASGGAE
ncbi:MAG: hypothetical protein DRI57_29500 [Deltaproteobacteria bacterium]|nr:MAG: hypothetical protein DRI57_29500 [Deltaproteobacteria bacterium]